MSGRRWWIPALGVSVAAGAVAVLGCRSSTTDLRGEGEAALERAEEASRAALAAERAAVEAGVDRFLALFDDFRPEAVAAAARRAYAADAYFNDGFAEREGADAVADYFARSAEQVDSIDIEVADVAWGEADVYVRWTMHFRTAGSRGRRVIAPGMSQLRFDREGRVSYHRDHWDASAALASFVPLVPTILDSIRGRLERD